MLAAESTVAVAAPQDVGWYGVVQPTIAVTTKLDLYLLNNLGRDTTGTLARISASILYA